MTIDQARIRVADVRRSGDASAIADALVSLAGVLVPAGDLAGARDALDEAAAIHEQEQRVDEERHCRQFGATLSRFLGDLDGARARATRAAALGPDGLPAAVSAAAELGETALAAGDAPAAARAFGDALRHAAQIVLRPADRSGLLRKQAAALAANGDAGRAVAALDEAGTLLEQAGDATLAIRTQVEAVTALQNAGRYGEADTRRARAFAGARRHNDEHALADLELLEAAAAMDRRDAAAALAAAIRARGHALRANAPVSYIGAAVAMAELYEHAGDRLNTYATLATGYATLGDLVGPEASRESFGVKLREYRDKWGADAFRAIKSAYEAQRSVQRIGADL